MNAWNLLMHLSKVHEGLWSVERPCQRASNSELRRWIVNGSLAINGICDRDPLEVIDYHVEQVVIHPKSATRRTTLFVRS